MVSHNDLEDTFVNVWVARDKEENRSFYKQWVDQASAKHSAPEQFGAELLHQLYPKHSLVMTSHYSLNILSFPEVQAVPLEGGPLLTNALFMPLARRLGGPPGILIDQVQIGAFNVTWQQYKFLAYIVTWPLGFAEKTQYFILHEGPEEPARAMLLKAGIWSNQLHDEIWVFNQGFWQKDHNLWLEIQKADWKDVILKDDFKKALQKDVYGFFASEVVYKQLAIPWKRGLIMYGPPGNGKTISLKTIMKTCDSKGFAPLYVKSFQSWMGEEGAMAMVFDKAREVSPCVIILEDLDSLINDGNRSFFLNQLDGLEGNDGLLVIGTTNHFERLDPGLSTRPSRFDRKYLFDDPDREERVLYAQYWQKKLRSNREIAFPDSLVSEVADTTSKFSFAYLKEAFVSALVTLANHEGDIPTFASVLKDQIKSLRRQLDRGPGVNSLAAPRCMSSDFLLRPLPREARLPISSNSGLDPINPNSRDVCKLLDGMRPCAMTPDTKLYRTSLKSHLSGASGANPQTSNERDVDVRPLLDSLCDSLARSENPDLGSRSLANLSMTKPPLLPTTYKFGTLATSRSISPKPEISGLQPANITATTPVTFSFGSLSAPITSTATTLASSVSGGTCGQAVAIHDDHSDRRQRSQEMLARLRLREGGIPGDYMDEDPLV